MEQLEFFEKLEEVKKPICPVCGNSFERSRPNQIKTYCSIKCRKIKYRSDNKDQYRESSQKYKKANRDKIRIYKKNKRKTDINYKLRHRLSSRIKIILKEKKKNSAINLLKCTIEEAREHIEKQFKEGMTWENHGLYGWHIDHIIPCASFDLTDPEQQKKCFHYTNLQPLWAKENMSKGAKIL